MIPRGRFKIEGVELEAPAALDTGAGPAAFISHKHLRTVILGNKWSQADFNKRSRSVETGKVTQLNGQPVPLTGEIDLKVQWRGKELMLPFLILPEMEKDDGVIFGCWALRHMGYKLLDDLGQDVLAASDPADEKWIATHGFDTGRPKERIVFPAAKADGGHSPGKGDVAPTRTANSEKKATQSSEDCPPIVDSAPCYRVVASQTSSSPIYVRAKDAVVLRLRVQDLETLVTNS